MTAFTAAAVIDESRNQHPELSPINVPQPLMWSELSRAVNSMYDAIYKASPALLAQILSVDLADVDFDNGGAIDLSAYIPNGWKVPPTGAWNWKVPPTPTGSQPVPSTFYPFEQRTRSIRPPAHTYRGNVIYILGPSFAYVNFGTFELEYIPQPESITADETTIPLPEATFYPLSLRLATFGLRRLVGRPQYKVEADDVANMANEASTSWKEYLGTVTAIKKRQVYRVKDVTPDPGGMWVP